MPLCPFFEKSIALYPTLFQTGRGFLSDFKLCDPDFVIADYRNGELALLAALDVKGCKVIIQQTSQRSSLKPQSAHQAESALIF